MKSQLKPLVDRKDMHTSIFGCRYRVKADNNKKVIYSNYII